MKKENMLYFLEAQLEKNLGDYDFAIDWNTKNHTVEVIAVIYAENKGEQVIDDAEGVQTAEDIIEFEDSLMLYNPDKFTPNAEEYLTLIPYEGKKGIKKAVLVALGKYLGQVLTEGESDLLDFLDDDAAEVFELNWNQTEFDALLEKANQSTDYIAYPKY
ncbi:DUF3013 family protein [Vagococcus coleopterorum]|uniref:DUF3013 family protein n=1 Tax=Vagococcus coleopterorum TaxID=2714946 RepID=A0A6G8AM72_9ENTE|nr:DUF3013 family protein [Vagococcus coleopterorum]QIL46097.1 DUF3013 family protein [Vagococcus coleopterorum]